MIITETAHQQTCRNFSTRRAQLGRNLKQLAKASGMTKQQVSQIMSEHRRISVATLRRVSMLLYCPPEALLSEDPGLVVRFPLPPDTYLDIIESNRDALGFLDVDCIPRFSDFVAFIESQQSDISAP